MATSWESLQWSFLVLQLTGFGNYSDTPVKLDFIQSGNKPLVNKINYNVGGLAYMMATLLYAFSR